MKFSDQRNWTSYIFTPVIVGLVFGVIEYTQANAPFTDIIQYIKRPFVSAIIIWAVMYPCMSLITGAFQKSPKPLVFRQILACLVGAIPLSVILPWAYLKFNLGGDVEELTSISVAVYDDILIDRYFKILLVILLLWTALTYKWYIKQETDAVAPSIDEHIEQAIAPVKTLPAFLDKMTKPIGRMPWAIKAEQHYIRIYTEKGDEMILYRFSDAIKSLEDYEGLQVHRSYWVAIEAIEEINPLEKSYEIKLKNGVTVPVSRSNKKQVEALKLI